MRFAWLVSCAAALAPAAWSQPLTYADALARASTDAPTVEARQAASDTARLMVGPASELPDPELALGLQNFPTSGANRFRLDRDDMTMFSVGVMQDMPSDAKRQARTGVATSVLGEADAQVAIARLEARLATANAWLQVHYDFRRQRVIQVLKSDVDTLARASSAGLAAGSVGPDAALSARMEVVRIEDRLGEVASSRASALAELERWIGPLSGDLPSEDAPVFVIDPVALRDHIEHHVDLAGSEAAIDRSRAELDLARAEINPDWSWELAYQRRDPAFGDMISLGVKFKLPLFQSTRQVPAIDARNADVRRGRAEREVVVREHRAMLESHLFEHDYLSERLARANDVILPLARQRAAIASASHAAGQASLADLIAIKREVLEAELARIDVEQRLARIDAFLTLEFGEAAQ